MTDVLQPLSPDVQISEYSKCFSLLLKDIANLVVCGGKEGLGLFQSVVTYTGGSFCESIRPMIGDEEYCYGDSLNNDRF